jgi:hypothetical protein
MGLVEVVVVGAVVVVVVTRKGHLDFRPSALFPLAL